MCFDNLFCFLRRLWQILSPYNKQFLDVDDIFDVSWTEILYLLKVLVRKNLREEILEVGEYGFG